MSNESEVKMRRKFELPKHDGTRETWTVFKAQFRGYCEESGLPSPTSDSNDQSSQSFKNVLINAVSKRAAMHLIAKGLDCGNDTPNEVWKELCRFMEGQDSARIAMMQYELQQLSMEDDEDPLDLVDNAEHLWRSLVALGEEIPESNVVNNVLRALPSSYDNVVQFIDGWNREERSLTKVGQYLSQTYTRKKVKEATSGKVKREIPTAFSVDKKKHICDNCGFASHRNGQRCWYADKRCRNCCEIGHKASRCRSARAPAWKREKYFSRDQSDKPPFQLTRIGWGTFDVNVEVHYNKNRYPELPEVKQVDHHLVFKPGGGTVTVV